MVTNQNVERWMSVAAHAAFWAGPIVVPMALFLVSNRRRPWVASHAAAAFNFQLTYALALVVGFGCLYLPMPVPAFAVIALIGISIAGFVAAVRGTAAAASDMLKPYRPVIRFIPNPGLPTAASRV